MKTNRIISLFIALLTLAFSQAKAAEVMTMLSSNFLVRGEEAKLLVRVLDGTPTEAPVIPSVPGLKIVDLTQGQPQWQMIPGSRRRAYVYVYDISSYQLGPIRIPPIQAGVDGHRLMSNPTDLEIFSPENLVWSEAKSEKAGKPIRYASMFRASKLTPYNGESFALELKIYFPANERVEDWGIPEFSRDGLTVWRFEPNRMMGNAMLLGTNYVSVSYPTVATPIRTGKCTIGPATVRLQTVQVTQGFGGFRQDYDPFVIQVAPLDLESKTLPAGAPAGFDGAVGQFAIASFSEEINVREGDPVSVTIAVAGTGNLDAIKPPKPTDAKGWKLYDAAALPRGEERREMSGQVAFRQFLRPLEFQPQIPAFQMVYFDPAKEAYQTIRTKPIALNVTPAAPNAHAAIGQAAPPPQLPMPVERMTDILGIRENVPVATTGNLALKSWWWQIIPATLALGMLLAMFLRWLRPRMIRDPRQRAIQRDLKEIERSMSNETTFFRAAGGFIERWLGTSAHDPSLAAILAERDQRCFRKEQEKAPVTASKARDILSTLRKAALPLLMFCFLFLGASMVRAEEAASPAALYQQGRYIEAIDGWLKAAPYERLTSDTLYNIGNSYYRLGAEGEAALYYRRALERDATHEEARQNLRFLERKLGSIVVSVPSYQLFLAKLSRATWEQMIVAAGWLLVLALLVTLMTSRNSGWRVGSLIVALMAPLLAICGTIALRYYPDEARFAAVEKLAVVVGDKAVARTDASRNSDEVIDIPMGSVCEIIQESGRWTYVSLATKTRGWLPTDQIAPVQPKSQPKAPDAKSIKPTADEGKSA